MSLTITDIEDVLPYRIKAWDCGCDETCFKILYGSKEIGKGELVSKHAESIMQNMANVLSAELVWIGKD